MALVLLGLLCLMAPAPAHGRRLLSADAADAATKGGTHVVVKQLSFEKPVAVHKEINTTAVAELLISKHKEINATAVAELISKHKEMVAEFANAIVAAKFNKTIVAPEPVAVAPAAAAPAAAPAAPIAATPVVVDAPAATPAATPVVAAAPVASTTTAAVVVSKGKGQQGPIVAVTAEPAAAKAVVVAPAHKSSFSVVASKGVSVGVIADAA